MTERAREWTFALVDLAGFTALTEYHGDNIAADLATQFADIAEQHLGRGDRLVKTLGDAVLLAADDAAAGLALVRGILSTAYETDGFPIARVGLHHGPATERRGDMFGAAINLTARVAAQASGGQVLATSAIAEAARAQGVTVTSLGAFTLRNVSAPVGLWELELCRAPADNAIDPVCRMLVNRSSAVGRLRHQESEYSFCSLACAGRFAAAPDSFVPLTIGE